MVALRAADPGRYRASQAAFRRYAPRFLVAVSVLALTACTQPAAAPGPVASVAIAPEREPLPSEPPPPETLIGADRDTLAERLGKPVFLMRAQASEIWQYRAQDCVLDLFLYEDAGAMRVTYIEARDLAGIAMAPDDCLRAVHAVREPWPDATTTGT